MSFPAVSKINSHPTKPVVHHLIFTIWKEVQRRRGFLQVKKLYWWYVVFFWHDKWTECFNFTPLEVWHANGSLCHAKFHFDSYILSNAFFGWACKYLNKYSHIKHDLNFSDEIKEKGFECWIPSTYQQKYKININKIKYTFCSTVKDTNRSLLKIIKIAIKCK